MNSDFELNVVILAAGIGSRMKSNLPKVLQPLANKPLILHLLNTLQGLKPAQCIIVYGHQGELVKQTICQNNTNDFAINWAFQEQQNGTAHATLQSIKYLQQSLATKPKNNFTLVLVGDTPLLQIDTLQKLITTQMQKQSKLTLLTAKVANPFGYGRIVRNAENQQISAIIEEKDANETIKKIKEINTGILLFDTNFLIQNLPKVNNNNAQKEYYLTDLIAMAVNKNLPIASNVLEENQSWQTEGVNTKLQLANLERIYQKHQAEKLLEKGITLLNLNNVEIRLSQEIICGKDVIIDSGVILEGKIVLGNNVKIGANCVLKNMIIEDNVIIEPFCHLENSIIKNNCSIGPFARLRPNSELGENVHIGNFVEVKKSMIGKNSKAGHLSYLGDAIIGEDVNIGAGTITCNYDGKHKHQTIINNKAFIGSGTQLVAPVEIGENAIIGAGTTLTKTAPENQITVSRSPQKSINKKIKK